MKNIADLKKQNGAVLIFVLIVLAAILMMMAYVIDLNAYYVRKTQADSSAKTAALSALEEYYDSVKTCTQTPCPRSYRLAKALERAISVAITNLMM